MADAFTLPIERAQPSQLLVSAGKLGVVLDSFDPDAPVASVDPLPCFLPGDVPFAVEGDVLLADGHTRALATVLAGADELRVDRVPDAERRDLSLDVYETCVGWCVDAGVTEPADLVGQVVSAETYEFEWVERCQAIAGAD